MKSERQDSAATSLHFSGLVAGENDAAEQLFNRFGVRDHTLREAVLVLFRLMHKNGINRVVVSRDGTHAHLEVS